MGELIPVYIQDCMPGDRFRISQEHMMRFAPMIAPPMQRWNVSFHSFFCPNRLIWPNWERFITGPSNVDPETGDPLPVPAIPTIVIGSGNYSKLYDYAGIPNPIGVATEEVVALPFAAYQKIYDEYYRDQNLKPSTWQPLLDGDNTAVWPGIASMRVRAWAHDYFTSALPFAQKGIAVDMPMGQFEDVGVYVNANQAATTTFNAAPVNISADAVIPDPDTFQPPNTDLFARTSEMGVSAITINDFRRMQRLQMWLEKNARGGTRYTEQIQVHFDERPEDMRLQRPQYIGGTINPVVVSEVLNTTGTDELPQGNMAGHGLSLSSGKNDYYHCKEHGYIITIMSVRPIASYLQGIEKHFLVTDPLEFPWPDFANLGEQQIIKKELYAFQGPGGEDIFGYTPRYAQHKYKPSRVAGEFRTTLNFWHQARIFGTPPDLNEDFVECNPDPRIFAVENEDHLWCHVLNKVHAVRPLPKYGVPHL